MRRILRRVWAALLGVGLVLTIGAGMDWLLPKLGRVPLPPLPIDRVPWLPWIGVGLLVMGVAVGVG